jgi:hypothetical protein
MIKKESDVGASTEGSAKSVSISVSMEYTGEFEIPEN